MVELLESVLCIADWWNSEI